MTAICAFETVKATSRIDVKQSCGSRPLTLQLVGKRPRSSPRAQSRGADGWHPGANCAPATGSGNL